MEKHKTQSEELASLTVKKTVSKFFNITFIFVMVHMTNKGEDPLKRNGLVSKIVTLVVVTILLNIVMEAVQPFTRLKKLWIKVKTIKSDS